MAAGLRLWGELHGPQADILTLVARQESRDMIPAILKLIRRRIALLDNRAKAYQMASKQAAGVGTAIWATKFKMAESVAAAESKITAAKNELEPKIHAAESAGQAAVAAALTGELTGRITAAITQGQDEVIGHAAYGAGEIATHQAKIAGWPAPDAIETAGGSDAATPLSTGTGSRAPAPLSPGDGSGIQPVDYNTFKDAPPSADAAPQRENVANNNSGQQPTLSQQEQQAAWNPDKVKEAAATPNPVDKGAPSSGQSVPPAASAPSSGGSSAGGNPASVVGQMMRPPMSSSPASSSPTSSGSGLSPTGAAGTPAGAQPGAGSPAAGAGAGSGAGAARGASVAGLGSGIAETSARMGTGAVSATANALGAAGNVVGSQVAQGAAAAAQATPAATGGPPSSPAAPPPATPAGGGAPMAMMPPPAGAATPVVGGPAGGSTAVPGWPNVGPGTPGTPPSAASGGLGAVGGSTSAGGSGSGANAGPAPVPVLMQQMTPMRALGGDGATGEELYRQAVDAAREVVEAMVAQSVKTGRLGGLGWANSNGWSVAASVIQERNGEFSAWLATSVGPSFVHRGVRIPEGVRLAVSDPVVGRELWGATAAAGGADPVEVVARHAEAREAASSGVRVLVLAASLPENRVAGWASELRTRAVSVDPRPIKGASVSGAGQHRCAVAMPWEWGQANAFDEQDRQRIAAKYMLMAATEGHLHGHAVERVMDKFERRTPITDTDWSDVDSAYMQAVIRADFARGGMSLEGEQVAPERAFRTMCAAEVVQCLREFHTAEGCADLLYATRLAGAPLKPADAVA
ncbi:hypothetical protein [Mycobacterium riyadhense]|uniref:hypothetical protein n=1 Tax=Mycobacterium riyadhense TaxID=486698 RepID=UPI00195A5991|nr:hypothetical protein [Mycobacterium riyadhense]